MRSLTAIILLLLVSPSAAQIQLKPIKTLRVEASSTPLYRIDEDGAVRIDWRRVEVVARSADHRDGDIARALMALRDRSTYTVMVDCQRWKRCAHEGVRVKICRHRMG